MGITKLHPENIDAYVRELDQYKFGGEKYQEFGNNCNNCAKAILKHALSPQNSLAGQQPPQGKWKSRYNRLGNSLRRLPRFMQKRMGKFGSLFN
jgi:hypothetical protein